MEKPEERKLSKHLEGAYELIGILPGEVIIKNVSYDFRTMSRAQADELFATDRGKKYLKKVEKTQKAS